MCCPDPCEIAGPGKWFRGHRDRVNRGFVHSSFIFMTEKAGGPLRFGLKTEGGCMGRTATTKTPRWPALSISAFLVGAVLLAAGVRPALASLVCGTKPEIAAEDGAQQIRFDAQIKVDRLRQAPPRTNLRAMVTASRRELRQAYASVEKPLLDHYLL
jgi:hypothetical protein